MIVAVEGPSAAGKTTWCRSAVPEYVEEYQPTGVEPDGSDPVVQATYWTEVNADRWEQAIALEQRSGLAICDSDPLKLHYSWCLARVGAAPVSRFLSEFAAVGEAMRLKRIGFADTVLLSVPDEESLRLRKEGDLTRSRRSFELHVRLREPLEEWYETLERLRPGTVRRGPLPVGAEDLESLQSEDRYDLEMLRAFASALPRVKEP